MKKGVLFVFVLIMTALTLSSCGRKQDGTVVAVDFQAETWGRFDYIDATYNVKKAPMTADLVLFVTVSDVFPSIYPYYDNNDKLSICLSISSPDGTGRNREYQFRLKDKDGNFKSERIDGYYNFELPLISGMSFSEPGDYTFRIENKYPKDPLYGIKSLTIKCLQSKN